MRFLSSFYATFKVQANLDHGTSVYILNKLRCSMVINPFPSCLVAFSNELFRTTTRLLQHTERP